MAEERDEIEFRDPPEDSEADVQGPKPSDIVTRWTRELETADRYEKRWRDRAREIQKLYADERDKAEGPGSSDTKRFNILYSNTEVLKGALYSQVPAPDVRRRFPDKNPVGRIAAMVLQRALVASLDQDYGGEDFNFVMKHGVLDMVLPGRATSRVKYDPTIDEWEEKVYVEKPDPVGGAAGVPRDVAIAEETPAGTAVVAKAKEGDVEAKLLKDARGPYRMEKQEEVTWEKVVCEHVTYEFFRYSPAKRWSRVRWVAFGELLTRDDCIRMFGPVIGNAIELKWMPDGTDKESPSEEVEILKRALVWTIWNKTKREVIVITEGYKAAPLAVKKDPLRLDGFFPMPRPMYFVEQTDSLIPVPQYTLYQDQALQLDLIEERIAALTDALRRRGVYDQAQEELKQLEKAGDNQFIGVKNYREFLEKGGLDKLFAELPIEGIAKVIAELQKEAEQKKQEIYELIGISDIMRGATKATETLGAQKIKDQWGSVRVSPQQGEVQRYARDVIRLKAEIMAEHFSPQTLAAMSGIKLAFTPEERAQIMQTNPQDERARRPTWAEIMQLLRDERLRGFIIDIETDSTIKHRADDEQKNRVDLTTAITSYLEKALPAVQQGVMTKKLASELLMFAVRAFPASPQIEEALDEWSGEGALDGQKPPPDPEKEELRAQLQKLQPLADENMVRKDELSTRREEAQAKREEVRARVGLPRELEEQITAHIMRRSQAALRTTQAIRAVVEKASIPQRSIVQRDPQTDRPIGIVKQ